MRENSETLKTRERSGNMPGEFIMNTNYNCRLDATEKGADEADPVNKEKNFIFLRIPVLRSDVVIVFVVVVLKDTTIITLSVILDLTIVF